uniref:uncharacterized protein LOC122583575 n=1 Tax=Erigeron canadensis TaxID=72917 RepID=UPI001CB92C3C|nr:uncharacterized protein LOC122583575 [Erigeron canadensis]
MLSNFQVGKNNETFHYSPHTFKISLQPDTKIKVIDNFVGPEHHFNFSPFSDIIENKLKPNQIVDIIGLVIHVGTVIPGFAMNKANKRRILRLEDADGLQIDCTLWDAYVDAFDLFLERMANDTPVIIIIKFGKIKGFHSNTISFGTALYATKVYINEAIPAVHEFKESLKEKVGNDEAKLKMASVSTQTVVSSPASFFDPCVRVTLDELPRITKEKDIEQQPVTPASYTVIGDNSIGPATKDAGSVTGDGGSNMNLKSIADSPPVKRLCVDLEDDDSVDGSSTRVKRKLPAKD